MGNLELGTNPARFSHYEHPGFPSVQSGVKTHAVSVLIVKPASVHKSPRGRSRFLFSLSSFANYLHFPSFKIFNETQKTFKTGAVSSIFSLRRLRQRFRGTASGTQD